MSGQLGLTFLTYPSAEHSRFSHTLGVAHVVKKLIGSISDVAAREGSLKAGGEAYPFFDPKAEDHVVDCLTHAALLHDVGHLGFSHAGEDAFMAAAERVKVGGMDLEDFVVLFRNASFESDLSECLSIAVCLSPRFRGFYEKVTGQAALDRRIGYLCSFIGGVPHDPSVPGLANLISGAAVDADKIDLLESGTPTHAASRLAWTYRASS